MAHLRISVPKDHVDDLRRELLRAHSDRVAALRRALDAYTETREPLDDVEGALVELADIDDALEQVGWEPPHVERDVIVRAHPEVLADALRELVATNPTPPLRELLLTIEREC